MRFELTTSTLARLRSTPSYTRVIRSIEPGCYYLAKVLFGKPISKKLPFAPHWVQLPAMALNDRLRQILETKKGEVARLKPKAALLKAAAAERNEFRSFQGALHCGSRFAFPHRRGQEGVSFRRRHRRRFRPGRDRQSLEAASAHAISVLTDEQYFQGHLQLPRPGFAVKSPYPVLRKDFIIDEVQIHEAVVAGADAISP